VELSKLHADLRATMIYVTHDQVEAMTMADRIVVLRDGRIEQTGSPLDLYNRPANRFVAGFIGSPKMNFIAATMSVATAATQLVIPGIGELSVPIEPGSTQVGQTVTVGVRPEHIEVVDQGVP